MRGILWFDPQKFLFLAVIILFTGIVHSSEIPIKEFYPNNTDIKDVKIYPAVDYSSIKTIVESLVDDSMDNKTKAEILYNFTKDNLYHKKAEYRWKTNWIHVIVGQLKPVYKLVYDPILLLNRYHYGYCSQQAHVLDVLAEEAGLESRMWYLNGHVVTEIYYNDSWHLYDPDMEVTYEKDGVVMSLEYVENHSELIRETLQRKGLSDRAINHMIEIYISKEDNNAIDDLWFHLTFFNKVAKIGSWLIPLIGLVLIFWYTKMRRR